jgi:hypothetical protein
MTRAKRWLVAGIVGAGSCFIAASSAQAQDNGVSAGGDQSSHYSVLRDFDERVYIGFKIAPVPLKLRGLDRSLVGLGSYIVNGQGACNDCHTAPPYAVGADPFNGEAGLPNPATYLAGGTAFGPFISRNITPRDNGRPANLTFERFYEVFTKGTDFKQVHPQISPLLQVMPWPVYSNMTPRDIRAIYEYLRAIPSLSTTAPSSANP